MGHKFLFIKNWNKENSHFCSRVPYLAPFRPRDKKSSHSSSEKTSSEVAWLEWKIQSKWVGKAKQKLYIFLTKKCTSNPPSNVFQDSEIDITKRDIKIYKERYFQPLS